MVNGEKVVDTNDNDQRETLKYRKRTIVLYVVGSRPNYGLVHDLAKKMSSQGAIDVFSRENGYFFFKFAMEDDLDRILDRGPGRSMVDWSFYVIGTRRQASNWFTCPSYIFGFDCLGSRHYCGTHHPL